MNNSQNNNWVEGGQNKCKQHKKEKKKKKALEQRGMRGYHSKISEGYWIQSR